LETAVRVNVKVQSVLYKAMLDHGVYMEGAILKANYAFSFLRAQVLQHFFLKYLSKILIIGLNVSKLWA